MRILRSIRSVNPEYGGPIEGIKQVSRIHQQTGHSVQIVSLDSPNDPWVRDCPLKVHGLGPARGRFGYSPRLVPWLRRQAGEFDAVIAHGIWQYNSLGVFLAGHSLRSPYFVFPHGMLDPWFKRSNPLKHVKKWLYWPWAAYRVLRNASAVCFTSEEERRLARQSFWLYHCNERVVAYGTSAPAGDPVIQRKLFWERFPETQGKRLILFLGRIHPKKGCDLLMRAFARTLSDAQPAEGQDLRLVMAGPDPVGWSKELERLAARLRISHLIIWTGMLTGDLKLGALHSADVFALPSHQENFGIAVAEAVACGLPVLISNKVNIWREIEQDGAGFVGNDDEEGTAQSLRAWLSLEKAQQQVHRDRARQCFTDRFEIHRAAESLLRVLGEDRFDKTLSARGHAKIENECESRAWT